MNEKRLNFAELAERLRVQECTVRRWSWEKQMPSIPCGNRRFFDLATVEQWLAERHAKWLARKAELKRAA